MLDNAKKRRLDKTEKTVKKKFLLSRVASKHSNSNNNNNNSNDNNNNTNNNDISGRKRSCGGSTLKGPVVSHAHGDAARDSGNDRRNVPFKDAASEKKWRQAGEKKNTDGVVVQRASGASSAAQRRAVLRVKGDDAILDHFKTKLAASTFRLLNEQIYNSTSAFASQLLRDKSTYEDYHTGYRQQLEQWPMRPSQVILDALLGDKRGRFIANKSKSMPGRIPISWVVADMGCGDAHIAQSLRPKGYTVHSFDFCAVNEHVTVANIAKLPLSSNTVDICVFSLSLMSTDYIEFLYEAFRVLKPGRLLKIVEVRSRIPHPRRFAEVVENIGFGLDYYDTVGDYFVAYDFLKCDNQAEANLQLKHNPEEVLVASVYKKR